MKDKTKKLLKKGLRLSGAIALTTLVLGGSFLLGFETGKATYQPKEEKSLSAASPKSALMPKSRLTHKLIGPVEDIHPNWAGSNSLYIDPNVLDYAPEGNITITGKNITITAVDTQYNRATQAKFATEVWIGWDNDEIAVDGYDLIQDGEVDIVFPQDGSYKIIRLEAEEYGDATIELYNYQWQPTFETALNAIIKDVRTEEYFSPNQTSDWLSLFTANGIGACLIENGATYEGFPVGEYGIEISGQFMWIGRILPSFEDVWGNTMIQTDNYGTPVRTATADQYDYLKEVRIYSDDFSESRTLTYNTWAYNGTSIYNGKMPDYWGYPGITDGSNVKIYHWGTMRTRPTGTNLYPNGEGIYRDYFEYLRIIGGLTMKDFEPIIVANDNANVTDVFTLIGSAFAGLAPFLAIQVLPSLTIGTLLLVPFIVTMVIVIIKMLRK